MSTLNFLGVAHSEIGSAILKKGEITLYSQKTESRNTNFKSIKYGLISEDKGSDTFLQGNLVCKIPKTSVCKLRNGVLLSLFACFQDGRQNHTESYIVVDSLFNVPLEYLWGFCVGLCFIMHLFVFFLFC